MSRQMGYVLSPDGNTAAQLMFANSITSWSLNMFEIDSRKMTYRNIDGRASDPINFSPDGKGIVYNVRQRGVDNLWLQPLDGSAFRQLPTSRRSVSFASSSHWTDHRLRSSADTTSRTRCCYGTVRNKPSPHRRFSYLELT
jgi:Tol biopolymer transport system component